MRLALAFGAFLSMLWLVVVNGEEAAKDAHRRARELGVPELVTANPSASPDTSSPSLPPSHSPTSSSPTESPATSHPSRAPSKAPSTSRPSRSPSRSPSHSPSTSKPSRGPSRSPSTSQPSRLPSRSPSTSHPSKSPTKSPTTAKPSTSPSRSPSTSRPTKSPTTSGPTRSPSKSPTRVPSRSPSRSPSTSPTKSPTTSRPTRVPTSSSPSIAPSQAPSRTPSTSTPSVQPTRSPTTSIPTRTPTSSNPTSSPVTSAPSHAPSKSPTIRTRSPTFPKKANVLIIIADDFKPLLNTYNLPYTDETPNINSLSARGISFMNAQSQLSVCGPSRASFLTSLRPDKLQIYTLRANMLWNRIRTTRKGKQKIETMPEWFKKHGYATYGAGKIFHENEYSLYSAPNVWTEPVYTWMNLQRPGSFVKPYQGSWVDFPEVEDDFFSDGQLADVAVNIINDKLSKLTDPWMFMVGFFKPHLPWQCPRKYVTSETAPLSQSSYIGNFNPYWLGIAKGGKSCTEVNIYSGIPTTNLDSKSPDWVQRLATRGYRATANYMDAQVGKVLDALKSSGMHDRTHVIFFGDHGFHLGDKGMYCKHTNFEQAVRVPLIIAPAPRETIWRTNGMYGRKSYAPVEMIDIFPTIADLVGIPMKLKTATEKKFGWQGVSLRSIMEDPKNGYARGYALAQMPRGLGSSKKMGYTFRTTRYRFTVWCPRPFKYSSKCYLELYDFIADQTEATNRVPIDPAAVQNLFEFTQVRTAKIGNFSDSSGMLPFDFAERIAMAGLPPQPFP